MIKTRLTFEGGAELAKNLEALSDALTRRVLRAALIEAAEPLRYTIGLKAPRSGDARGATLAEEIVISPARGQDADEVAVAVGPTARAFYGGFQEFGTAHHSAQPFMRPAFDEEVDAVLALIAEILWRELSARNVTTTSAPSTPTAPGGGGVL